MAGMNVLLLEYGMSETVLIAIAGYDGRNPSCSPN